MNEPPTLNLSADEMSVRLALGSLTFRERLRLIWFIILGSVAILKGSVVLSAYVKRGKVVP